MDDSIYEATPRKQQGLVPRMDSSRFNDITSHRYPTCGIVNLSWDTGEGWSNMAGKVAYESRRDYIIAVKGKMRLRVTLSTQSESAAFRRISLISSSGDLWCGVVHDGVTTPPLMLVRA